LPNGDGGGETPAPRAGLAGCTITRGPGNDVIRGTPGDDVICAGSGNDVVYGGDGNDTIRGGSGNDVLRGGSGNDTIRGGSGNDVLRGGDGNDRLTGGPGRDRLYRNGGADTPDARDGRRGNDVATAVRAQTRAPRIPATWSVPAERGAGSGATLPRSFRRWSAQAPHVRELSLRDAASRPARP